LALIDTHQNRDGSGIVNLAFAASAATCPSFSLICSKCRIREADAVLTIVSP
jgi:hypothetical protein